VYNRCDAVSNYIAVETARSGVARPYAVAVLNVDRAVRTST